MNCQKHLFSLPAGHHYLNCAYLSPLLKAVEEAGVKGIEQKKVPWTLTPDEFFSDSYTLRELFARLVNTPRANQVAILPSVSYGFSTVAKNLPRNGAKNIIVPGEQFPSNIYPWKRFCKNHGGTLKAIEAPAGFEGRGKKWNERILEAIDSDTLLVALGNIHWADGTLFKLEEIGKRAREVGAYFVIDGTQSVGALPLDVQKIKPDALICAGYKWLMGPYSMALGYFGPRFADGLPLEEGWIVRKNSEDFSSLVNYEDEYQPGALRYDVGERSNFVLVPMMIEAIKQLLEWTPRGVQQYCTDLTSNLITELPKLGYQIEDEAWRAHHLFGIRLPKHIKVEGLKEELNQRNIYLSFRGSAVRISPHVYNNEKDVAALLQALTDRTNGK